ncbi:uncharacterized protein SAPINGB_P004777 [Magnusiomyces paraingens]|uniref:F-box domain-containing protein n=1 Tax=Magnusiomyces paraingens TaxID=2606893 RepID=A0A5E8BWH3_9ASCO|nr:uncharacterized protein SAPINGB_P004777 [Saprochaete ingens]VVT55866.1 unnamed protein product [Saprochaete ingens]
MVIPTLTPFKPISHPPGYLETLPKNIFNNVTSFLSVPDLCALAQTSRTLNRAVTSNEDIWITRLQNMGLWGAKKSNSLERLSVFQEEPNSISENDTEKAVDILSPLFAPIPGKAKDTYMKIYKVLRPLYNDIVQSGTHQEPLIFRLYRKTVDQASILAQLKIFSKSDPNDYEHYENLDKFNAVYEMFENAALAEFEVGYDQNDIDGKVKKYAHALVTLNGGDSCVQLFIQKNHIASDYITDSSLFVTSDTKKLDNKQLQSTFKLIADSLNNEAATIDKLFPPNIPVFLPLCESIIEDNISELFNFLISFFRKQDNINNYLEAVPFLYVHMMWFINELKPSQNSGLEFRTKLKQSFLDLYDFNIDTYLDLEYQEFSRYAAAETTKWNEEVTEHEIATETFLLSNVTKEKDKSDILSSFKRVLMMPVSVIPFGNNTNVPDNASRNFSSSSLGLSNSTTAGSSSPARPGTPSANRHLEATLFNNRPGTSGLPLPTTELDARAAVMNNKLEGINTLFSLELALNIMRHGRDSIERASKFISAGGATGEEAREKCEEIFVELVKTIGGTHVRDGFEKALDILNKYDAKTMRKVVVVSKDGDGNEVDGEDTQSAVEPLAIFAELVNIGDLIQQMIHVFFEEELAVPGYIDRLSFISPANREKKKFEKMLDSYVANGMNRGIDVLMEQIEYILLTEQKGSDFNPSLPVSTSSKFKSTATIDITPTKAALNVVSLLKTHVNLLAGSTEKSVIDVFQQEIAVRFFGSLSKHIKRQVISINGAVRLLSDLNLYYNFILSLNQRPVIPYFAALKEVGQMFLIDGKDTKALGQMLSDMSRFGGIFQPEEIYEFVQCREDWLRVRRSVEKVMYGFGLSDCNIS